VADDDTVTEAARVLYAAAPDEFTTTRAALAQQARAAGDPTAAAQIQKLRKPTVAAWIVNAAALDDPGIADRLTELGDELRAAQQKLDAATLRELSTRRRSIVAEIGRRAFQLTGRKQPPAGLRDEVLGTLDAAVADPAIAARLGRLERAEQWSGFGFAPGSAPELTLVRGGRADRPRTTRSAPAGPKPARGTDDAPSAGPSAPPKPSAAERRRKERELSAARAAFDEADLAYDRAQTAERDLAARVKELTRHLAAVQKELDDARGALDRARKDVSTTRARRRETRSDLDRTERTHQD
jgi:hypothetical protein